MQYTTLGTSGIRVSRLCFGSLTMGPLQAGLTIKEGAGLIRRALELGVNFIDTAQCYNNYPYIRAALKGWSGEVVVATKSYDYTAEGMALSLEEARREMDREVIDIFLLHEQETALTLAGHRPALDYLLEARERGLVRAVGISSHAVEAVRVAATMPEIDVIHPLYNRAGLGILDGTREEMLAAITLAHTRGKGIYAMKALGGGHLAGEARAALEFVLKTPGIDAVAVGMQSPAEVEANVAWCSGREPGEDVLSRLQARKRCLLIEEWCQGCGNCVRRCPQGALEVIEGRAVVDPERCILCGYCAGACRDFCIKVI
ncbi:aldo/keto reductase [Moorella thermoacetica]|uniref:General stress protein 69 n=2 Tax=Neomoorella thermoacetica TaxID=1525 RepID=A0A1D7XBT2_NEOTH|nr:aldo/keto reductase [Moorella thermoacetica]AKX94440.1 general stress protein 69 [Moorella thermoacetica]AKX97076.1 general stress protein 69 [Moorella thermoacetica]AOQ24378.1 General stress protein 69 [Moorella thermoacetica]OIQ08431.1 general stress protein 69 [Moorella thermoacetica]OIQ11718.1 general stress protein 69 [Moorella thermoacetica]